MNEYGGYLELDSFKGEEYYSNAIGLNCGRNCLAYLIEIRKINTIYLPYYLCASVVEICKKYNLSIKYYHIDFGFNPILEEFKLQENEYIYVVNYFGQLDEKEILKLKKKFKNLILDNAQNFFSRPYQEIDTIYTCRKYFGVSDGAYLFTNDKSKQRFTQDVSYKRMQHILGRYEKSANEFYGDFLINEKKFSEEPIKYMSKLTHNILKGIDYEKVMIIREKNFTYLHNKLKEINGLSLNIQKGPFAYPLLIEKGSFIREKMQKEKFYIPMLWPEVLQVNEGIESQLAADLLPLPIDQRYTEKDMDNIVEIIRKYK